jgi:hypothetical protein
MLIELQTLLLATRKIVLARQSGVLLMMNVPYESSVTERASPSACGSPMGEQLFCTISRLTAASRS